MSNFLARSLLNAYRLAGAGIYPLLGPYLSYRASKGKEERARRYERYGRSNLSRPDGPLIWFHAASVGETVAVIPLIEEVVRRQIAVILTTGTVTSANIVAERLSGKVQHQYVPLDLKPAISNFLDHWQPDMAIISESEIWPMTILELGNRRMPQVLVNGRISDKSFATWSRNRPLAEALFENLSHVVAQSEIDAERFISLGASPVTISGNLKVDTEAPPHDAQLLKLLREQMDGRPTWAAISTFDGEEEIAANAHALIRQSHEHALTIIIPRHVERADNIEQMLIKRGLKVARRSRNDEITPEIDVFLGDTTGEMGLYLRLTSIVFVGKSMSGAGGQNPLEPAMLNCAILTGANVQNFRDTFQQLLRNGAARIVKDDKMMADCVSHLLSNADDRGDMIAAGRATVEIMKGSLDKTIADLEPYLMPLMIEKNLNKKAIKPILSEPQNGS